LTNEELQKLLKQFKKSKKKIKKKLEYFNRTSCGICYCDYNIENNKICALIPCGHILCSECTKKEKKQLCPFCRKSYTYIYNIYFP
jgi:hypothetical protein